MSPSLTLIHCFEIEILRGGSDDVDAEVRGGMELEHGKEKRKKKPV